MKILSKVAMGAAALTLLVGCSSLKQVEYKEFHEKAVAAWKDVPYTKATVNGHMKQTVQGQEYAEEFKNVEVKLSAGSVDAAWAAELATKIIAGDEDAAKAYEAAIMVATNATVVPESKDYKYYVGGGFKLEMTDDDEKATMTWDKYAMLTGLTETGEGLDVKLTVKYSK